MWRAIFGPKALALSLVAILAIVLCVDLGKWQWHRKEARDQVNRVLTMNLKKPPVPVSEIMSSKAEPKSSDRWRRVEATGIYEPVTYYVRGRSYQGKYGYAVLSILRIDKNALFIDRGWIAAPGRATETPVAPAPPSGVVQIVGRVRGLDSLDNPGLGGALFGLPFKQPESVADFILKTPESGTAIKGYIELVSSTPTGVNQPVPLDTPEITPGPHLAYAVQWYLFALLFLIGRVLLGRDEYRTNRHSEN